MVSAVVDGEGGTGNGPVMRVVRMLEVFILVVMEDLPADLVFVSGGRLGCVLMVFLSVTLGDMKMKGML